MTVTESIITNGIHPPTPALKPSLPIPNPCLSFWQRTTRGFPYLQANRSNPVPTEAKYVIIGSGISGSLTAFELLKHGVSGEDVVILEARGAVSGASGRNAGHVRPDAFRGFQMYTNLHGPEQAVKIIADERRVFSRIDEFTRTHTVPCDFRLTSTFDVCMTPEFADYAAASFESFQAAGGDVSHVRFYGKDEASTTTRVKGAASAYEWPAGSIHPAKLAQWLLSSVISRGVRLYTHCPVDGVTSAPSSTQGSPIWAVHTPRGSITTPTLVHCTNAHAAYLIPELAPYLTPNKAQAHSIVPTPKFTGDAVLNSTFSLRYELHHFYSVIQRGVAGDGTIILGTSRNNPRLSEATRAAKLSTDDSGFSEETRDEGWKAFKEMFGGFDSDQDNKVNGELADKREMVHGEGLYHSWTGIIGMTDDHVPFIGPIDGCPGQWACVGFNGHGMARIFTCAPGLVKLMMGEDWKSTGLPECFHLSQKRLEKLHQKRMAKQ